MLRKSHLFLLLALLAFLGWGLIRLFQLRYEGGDVYPAYSSLRTDPLGTKAYYESLDLLRGINAFRNFRTLDKLTFSEPHTIFLFGIPPDEIGHSDTNEIQVIDRLFAEGHRLVVTMQSGRQRFPGTFGGTSRTNTAGRPGKPPPPLKKIMAGVEVISLFERWNFELQYEELNQVDGKPVPVQARLQGPAGQLPAQIDWRSGYYFKELGPEWKTIYQTSKGAVVVERAFGKGSLVLTTDSYPVSNEAIRQARLPALLAWMAGSHRQMVFDESHFGLMEQPGVATLLRNYGLQPMIGALIALGLLFIWKNATSLVPRQEGVQATTPVAVVGRDSFQGFANLLRRGIAEKDLIQSCYNEWQKSALGDARERARIPEMILVVEAENQKKILQRNPLEAYRRLTEIVRERNKHGRS